MIMNARRAIRLLLFRSSSNIQSRVYAGIRIRSWQSRHLGSLNNIFGDLQFHVRASLDRATKVDFDFIQYLDNRVIINPTNDRDNYEQMRGM